MPRRKLPHRILEPRPFVVQPDQPNSYANPLDHYHRTGTADAVITLWEPGKRLVVRYTNPRERGMWGSYFQYDPETGRYDNCGSGNYEMAHNFFLADRVREKIGEIPETGVAGPGAIG